MKFIPIPTLSESSKSRFWRKALPVESGCLEWQGGMHEHGYGKMKLPNTRTHVYAHRVAYSVAVGPIAPDMVIDHLCRNRRCINPDHLEQVTQRVNVERGDLFKGSSRDVCASGHDISGTNAMPRNGGQSHVCRECNRNYMREYMRKRRIAQLAA